MIVRPVLCRPFVGRHQELKYLRERRLEAGLSRGGFVLVAGDAGLGKSRLINEFCTSIVYSRWKIGRGACLQFAGPPYGPVREIFAQLDPKAFDSDAAATQREQFDRIADRLARTSARTAVALVIEDIHWADAATLDLLVYLSAKVEHMRVLVLASVRSEELHSEHPAAAAITKMARSRRFGRIDLEPLRGKDLQVFVAEALESIELPAQSRRAALRAGEGNPFFTEELLKSAVERDARGIDASARGFPQTVRATLLERLRPFTENERRIIAQAAAIGRTFQLELLTATLGSGVQDVLPALNRARDFQLVEEQSPGTFRFRHGLTREAIYGEFLAAEMQPRHREIAIALESAPPDARSVEALAYHWWAAGNAQKSAEYNDMAGDAAAAVHAHEDAIAFYERALESNLDPQTRGSIVKKIADRRLALGWTKEAQATYGAAADEFREAGLHELEAGCRVTAAITAYGIGLSDPAGPLAAMLERLDPADYLARSRVQLGLAWLWATFAFPFRAAHYLEAVDERALLRPDLALRFHNVWAFIAMTTGDLEVFRREYAAWLDAARAGGALQHVAGAYTNGAMAFAFFGLHEAAQEAIEAGHSAARAARSRHAEESVYAFDVLCCFLRGDLAAARAALDRVSPASENRVNITFATAFGTMIGVATGDRDLITVWFDGFEEEVLAKPEVEHGAGFAEVLMRRGRHEEARALLDRCLPECELVCGNVPTLLAIGLYGRPEDQKRARAYLERASHGSAESPECAALALFDAREHRRHGRVAEARDLARAAAEGFRRLRYPLLEAAALEAAGDCDAAVALYRTCGAAYDVRRLTESIPSAPAPLDALSLREQQIATLAAAGRSNVQIAGDLSITHKTVEKHLASAYRKLGVKSRTLLSSVLSGYRKE